MPKRSPDRPHLKSKYEQVRVDQLNYGKMEKEPSKVNSIFLERPHYGIPAPEKGAVKDE
jgi:hypothetical protein